MAGRYSSVARRDGRVSAGAAALNRRRFLAAAAGAGAVSLAACGGSNNRTGGNTGNTATHTAGATTAASPSAARGGSPVAGGSSAAKAVAATPAPKKGGTIASGQVTDLNLNTGYPYVIWPQDALLHSAVQEPLIRYRDSLQPEPVLAERFELNSDRTSLTITLRQGLAFHNGAPVTPEDVFFGLDVVLDPAKAGVKGGNFQIINFVKAITDRKKVDARTMQFTFDRPRVNIADLFAQLEIAQAGGYDKLMKGEEIAGTGPYLFKTWNPGQGYRLEPNKNWWGTSQFGGPYLDAIDVKLFADFDAMGLAFQSGALDSAAVTATVARPFRDKGQTQIGHKAGLNYAGCNVTNPLLKDKRVRQALFYGLDRTRFVNEVQEGFGKVTAQPWPESSPAFDPALEAALFDPNRSKDLLKQAGFSQDRPLALEYSSPASDSYAAVIKDNWEAIGVKIELKPTEGNAFTNRFQLRQFPDFWIASHSFSDLSPLTNFQQTFPYRIPNIGYYENPDYLDIIKQLEALDPLGAPAKEQYIRFNKLWLDEPWLFPLTPTIGGIEIVSPKVHGLDVHMVTISNQHDYGRVWKG